MSVYKGSTKVAGNSASHTHSNKNVIDKFSEVSGNPYYNGSPIGGGAGKIDDPVEKSENQILRYDGSDWIASNENGHTILPTPNSTTAPTEGEVVSAVNSATGGSENIVSLWGTKNWSNTMTKRIVYNDATHTIGIGATGIGYWPTTVEYAELMEMSVSDRAVLEGEGSNNDGYNWWYNDAFKDPNVSSGSGVDLSNDDQVDIAFKFDPLVGGEPLTLGGYIIDTDTGYMCIKFGRETTTATHKVAVDLMITRNNVGLIGEVGRLFLTPRKPTHFRVWMCIPCSR